MKKLLLAVTLAFFCVFAHAQANAQIPPCMWSSGVNKYFGGVVTPPVAIVGFWCAPASEYANYRQVIAAARLDLLTEDTKAALQAAILSGDDAPIYALRTYSLTAPELAPYIASKQAEIDATKPPPVWVVRKNGTAATRVAYAHAASSPTLGAKSATIAAPVGMACYCANPAYRYNSGTSIYCPFALSLDQWKRDASAGAAVVTICDKAP